MCQLRGHPGVIQAAAPQEPPAGVGTSVPAGIAPPWQQEENNDSLERGLSFTEPDADNLADFHGSPQHPELVLYVGGNYFFAMAPLVKAFEARYPQYRGRLYWETLPPGLLLQQIKAGGTITVGNMTWTVKPDVYLAGLRQVRRSVEDGTLIGPPVPYVTNTLAIMVKRGNPRHIRGLKDLATDSLRLAMPNPEFEGIARQIRHSLEKAGGPALADRVYEGKVTDGTTVLTHIHHRQTPLWIMEDRADAGVTWQSEVVFQREVGHPIEGIEIPAAENTTGVLAGALVKGAPHPEAGRRWLEFIRSDEGRAIFARYGFKPYTEGTSSE